MTSFPIGSRVVLHGLKKETFNGKKGVVRSSPNAERQEIYVDGSLYNLKMTNLKFDEKSSSSLSVKECKVVLTAKGVEESAVTGLTKSELMSMVEEKCSDGQERMRIIAEANAPATAAAASPAAAAAGGLPGGINVDTIRSQADQMANMDPAQLRQQASMLRTMTPSQIRQMNPMMANFSDDQIKMAASQMEMMASNPAMMKTMAEQMKGMDQSTLENMGASAAGGAGAGGAGAGAPAFPSSQYGTVVPPRTPASLSGQISPEQMQQAQQQMANMSPEQLRQQANMLKSMTPDQLRQMNPAMANMSDAQIKQSAAQLEMMANNPEMMKMATEQMKNMSAEDVEELRKCQESMFGSGSTGGAGDGNIPTDPSQVDPTKMDPAQVKKMVGILKKNPAMVKQMMASQPGMAGQADGLSDEQLSKMLDTFDGMSEDQIKMAMGVMGKAQKVLAPVTVGWQKANKAAGGQLGKMILFLIAFLIIRSVMNWMMGGASTDASGNGGGESVDTMIKETMKAATSQAAAGGEQDEFAEEL